MFLVSIYTFIPATINIQRNIRFSSSDINSTKYISSSNGWKKWWPEKTFVQEKEKNTELCYRSFCYRLVKMTNTNAEILVINKSVNSTSKLIYVPVGIDSIQVSWQTSLPSAYSPVKRIMNYKNALKISRDFDDILLHMKSFFDNEKLVYGLNIKREIVRHKLLLAKEKTSAKYPDINFVDDLVSVLRKTAKKNAATVMGPPMLSIYKPYKKNYVVTVAIPVNKEIPSTEGTFITKMVDGTLLVTEIKGGPNTIKNAFSSFHQYVKDKRLTPPAMPYEMMITDRSAVSDTSKWITQIYYPVF